MVLDKCREDNLMVIMTVALDLESDVNSQRYLKVVNAHKNHPAILMWAIGEEWNIRKYWDDNKALLAKAEIVNVENREFFY